MRLPWVQGQVSIPSSSGLRLEFNPGIARYCRLSSQSLLHQVCGWNGGRHAGVAVRHVSIPSSSGLRLECQHKQYPTRRTGLNPFFIRSAVGMRRRHEHRNGDRSQSLLHQVCGWNPVAGSDYVRPRSLNPFFIRSAVGIWFSSAARWCGRVSIPSSSGLRLESTLMDVADLRTGVSIPSSSGLRLE